MLIWFAKMDLAALFLAAQENNERFAEMLIGFGASLRIE
jgi:hypothetical protein